jgi:hypothetical protein
MRTQPDLPSAWKAAVDAHSSLEAQLRAVEQRLADRGKKRLADRIARLRELGNTPVGDLVAGLRRLADKQLALAGRELQESRDALDLVRRRITGEIHEFSAAEESYVRTQLGDLLKIIPASLIALAPLPGVAVITPLVLKKLNLLPSAWREEQLQARLARIADALAREAPAEAAEVQRLAAQVRASAESARRRARVLHPSVRALYDFDVDGVIDDHEWEALEADRRVVAERIDADWYCAVSSVAEGPFTARTLLQSPLPEHALVWTEGLIRWVPVELLAEVLD